MASNTPRLDLVERNLIINGNMDFWQRGTSFSEINNTILTSADRWKFQNTNSTAVTLSQSTDVPTVAQSGYQSVFSLLATNASISTSANAAVFLYNLEGQDYQQIHGKKARLQFWCKSSVAGTYSIGLRNAGGTRGYVSPFTIAATGTWQKVAIDITLDNSGTWAFDNTVGLNIIINLQQNISGLQTSTINAWQTGNIYSTNTQVNWAASAGATFNLAQVMLIPQDYTQAGSATVDVPFQRCGRNISEELRAAQRYFERPFGPEQASTSSTIEMTGFAFTTSAIKVAPVAFKVTKRAPPAITITSNNAAGSVFTAPGGGGVGTYTTSTITDNSTDHGFCMNANSSGTPFTQGQGYDVAGVWWAADSEL